MDTNPDLSVPAHGEGSGEFFSQAEAQDELLLAALVSGQTYAEAADVAGVGERTVGRRAADPAFAAELGRRRAAHVSQIAGTLLTAAPRAVAVILECLDAERPADRLRAADLLLAQTRRFLTDSDVLARLAALENPALPAELYGSTHGGPDA